jgi:hypothetical protein
MAFYQLWSATGNYQLRINSCGLFSMLQSITICNIARFSLHNTDTGLSWGIISFIIFYFINLWYFNEKRIEVLSTELDSATFSTKLILSIWCILNLVLSLADC